MKKVFFLASSTLVMAAIVLALVLVFPAQAGVIINEKIPIKGIFPACVEPVALEGTDHIMLSAHTDGNGGIHVNIHVNTHVSGVGLRSGGKYVGNGKLHDSLNLKKGGTATRELAFKLVGQGKLPDFTLRETFKITVNANGVVTVLRGSSETECK